MKTIHKYGDYKVMISDTGWYYVSDGVAMSGYNSYWEACQAFNELIKRDKHD